VTARLLGLLAEALDLWQQREAARAVLEEDDFVAQLAAGFITPDQLGDEEHAVLAVHTARLVVKHSRRDQTTIPLTGGSERPS
jgi:hypothetical protein